MGIFEEEKVYNGIMVRCYENNGYWYAIPSKVLNCYTLFNYKFDNLPNEIRADIIEDLTEAYDSNPKLVSGFISWVDSDTHYLTIYGKDGLLIKNFTLVSTGHISLDFRKNVETKRKLRSFFKNALDHINEFISEEDKSNLIRSELERIENKEEWVKNGFLIEWNKEKRQFYIEE